MGNNLATIVSLVDAHDGSLVSQKAEGSLEGKTIGDDALYAHKDLCRTLIQDHGSDVMAQLKVNQKTSFDQANQYLNAPRAPPF